MSALLREPPVEFFIPKKTLIIHHYNLTIDLINLCGMPITKDNYEYVALPEQCVMAFCCPAAEFDASILKADAAGLYQLANFTRLPQPTAGIVFSYLNITEQRFIHELPGDGACYSFASYYFQRCNLSYRALEKQPGKPDLYRTNTLLYLKIKYSWTASLAWFCGLSCSKLVFAPCAIPISHFMVNVGKVHKMEKLHAEWGKQSGTVTNDYKNLMSALNEDDNTAATAFAALRLLCKQGFNYATMRTEHGAAALVKINKAAEDSDIWKKVAEAGRQRQNKLAVIQIDGEEERVRICHPDRSIEYAPGQRFFGVPVNAQIEICDAPEEHQPAAAASSSCTLM